MERGIMEIGITKMGIMEYDIQQNGTMELGMTYSWKNRINVFHDIYL